MHALSHIQPFVVDAPTRTYPVGVFVVVGGSNHIVLSGLSHADPLTLHLSVTFQTYYHPCMYGAYAT